MTSNDEDSKQESLDRLVSESLTAHYKQISEPEFDELIKPKNSSTSRGLTLPRPLVWKWIPAAAIAVAIAYVGCPTVMNRWGKRQQELNQAQVFFQKTNWHGPTDFLIDDLPNNEQLSTVPQFDGSM